MKDENDEATLDLDAIWGETDDLGEPFEVEDSALADDPNDEGETDPSEDESEGGEGEEDDTGEADNADEGEEGDTGGEEPPVDYKALFERSQHEVKTMVGRLKAAESKIPKEQPTVVAPASPSGIPEEETFLKDFSEKYHPEVVRAIDLITTNKAKALIEETLTSRLTPLEAAAQDLLGDTHFRAIEAVHPDLDQIDASPIFESWIASKPAFLKPVYENIRANGSPAQVIEMLNEYKAEIGAVTKQKTTVKPADAKAIAATAVNRRRGTAATSKQPDANDLEAIWAETED